MVRGWVSAPGPSRHQREQTQRPRPGTQPGIQKYRWYLYSTMYTVQNMLYKLYNRRVIVGRCAGMNSVFLLHRTVLWKLCTDGNGTIHCSSLQSNTKACQCTIFLYGNVPLLTADAEKRIVCCLDPVSSDDSGGVCPGSSTVRDIDRQVLPLPTQGPAQSGIVFENPPPPSPPLVPHHY